MSEQGEGVTVEAVTRLRVLLERHACLRGDFVLSSGLKSKYYFDSKPVTLSPDGRALIGRIFEPIVREAGAEAVGGLVIGAVPISDAIELPSFIVREEKKGHGTKERIAASYSIRGAHGDLRRRGGAAPHGPDRAGGSDPGGPPKRGTRGALELSVCRRS